MDDKPDSSNDVAAVRDLAMRLLSYDLGGGRLSQATDLLVGKLPEGMPVEVPILEDSRVIGSLVHDMMGYNGYSILLGSDIPSERIYNIYDTRLRAAGWEKPDLGGMFPHQGGFTMGDNFDRMLAYYKGDQGPTLQVLIHKVADGSSEVRLNLNTVPQPGQNRARMERMARMHAFDAEQIIPDLKPPRNGQQWPKGGGGGGDHWNSNAELVTDQDTPSVAAHYTAQLQAGGWTPMSDGQTGQLAWSIWDYKGKEGQTWIGQLFIMERPLEKTAPRHRYFLSVHMHKLSGDVDNGGDWNVGHTTWSGNN